MPVVENTEVIDGQEVTILIQVDEAPTAKGPYEDLRGGADRVLDKTRGMFEGGLELARHCARQTVDAIYRMEDHVRPTEFEIQLSIAFNSELGAMLVKANAGAQMQVTMRWLSDELED